MKIDKEIKSLVPPLRPEELKALDTALTTEGCRNPFVVWKGKDILLDGHHRYGQIMLADPNGTMKVLRVPLGIDMLLKMCRSYGNAIGNTQRN